MLRLWLRLHSTCLMRADRKLEDVLIGQLKQGSLEAKNNLWVNYGRRLRTTPVDLLLWEELELTLAMLQDLVDSLRISEHDSHVISSILVGHATI